MKSLKIMPPKILFKNMLADFSIPNPMKANPRKKLTEVRVNARMKE